MGSSQWTPKTLAIRAQDPTANEFLSHPDLRQIAAFFLGWVFISSLNHLFSSSIIQNLLLRITFRLSAKSGNGVSDPEAVLPTPEKSPTIWTTHSRLFTKGDNHTLVFTLCLCFTFASIAQFSSLLTFDSNKGATACAFVVAWGGMAAQSARLIGLLILSFELRQLGISRWENIVLRIWLGVGLVFVFVTNALSNGNIKPVSQLGISLCYRKHFLPTSLVSSFIYFILEIYVVIRLAWLIAPVFLQLKHRIGAMADLRVLRGLSLIFLELLTIVPTATFTSIVGEFIPFSIGALAVLAAFNYRSAEKVELRVTSVPPSLDGFFSPNTVHSLVLPVDLPQVPQPLYRPPSILNHPYAAKSLNDPTLDYWRRPKSSRSSRTIDSITAKSITNAVIQVASKGSRTPLTRLPEVEPPFPLGLQNHPPAMPSGTNGGVNIASPHLLVARQILPDQIKYAEPFERPSPKKVPLSIVINTDSPALQSWPSGDTATPKSPRSPSSVVYGSDIIRVNPQSGATDAMRRSSRTVSAVHGSRHSYLTSSPRETLLSARSTRRYSWASMLPPSEDLPVVYEASVGATSRSEIIPRPRIPTFGEHMFENSPPFTPRPRTSTLASPRIEPDGQRSSGIRGPRPPPPSLFQAKRYMASTQLVNDRYRRRRSGSFPIGNLLDSKRGLL